MQGKFNTISLFKAMKSEHYFHSLMQGKLNNLSLFNAKEIKHYFIIQFKEN